MKPGDKAVSYADDEAYYVFALDTDDADIIVAIDGTTADEKWRLDGVREACRLTLVGDDRLVVVGTPDGPLGINGEPSLNVVDRSSGEVLGSAPFEDAPSTYCLPLQASGEVLWRQVLDDFRNTPIPVTIVGDRLFETSFGGPALIAMAMDDGRPLEELTGEELFGDDNTHREVHGPAIGDRLLVEGNTPEGQLLVTLLDLSALEGAD